jgi:predicted PilT family ATPase
VNLTGRMDKAIAEYAKKHDLILITEDKKPAELSDLLGGKYFYVDNKTKAQMIHEMIKGLLRLSSSIFFNEPDSSIAVIIE